MFYRNKGFIVEEVFKVTRKKGNSFTKAREFSGLAFRISGKSTFFFGGKGEVSANKGSITYIPEGVDFETHSEDEEIIILHLKSFYDKEKKIISFVPQNYEIFLELFCSIEEEWQRRKIGYKSRCTALLYNVFENLEKNAAEFPNNKNELIKNGVTYMKMHYDNPELTVKKLAEKCSISEVYYRKIYKEQFGTSPLKAINNLRIKRACSLLKSGYYNVTQAAAMSGFEDAKYFSTIFKKSIGVTPGEYVKINTK